MTTFNGDVIDYTALFVLSVGFMVYTPLIIHYWRKFNSMRHEQMIKYRSPILVNTFNAISLSTLIIYESYICFGRVLQLFEYPLWSFYFVIGINWWCALGLFATKTYLLFYNQKYNMALVNSVWQSDINPLQCNWYISHKSTFGNINWILRTCFLPFYVSSVILSTIFPTLIIENHHSMFKLHLLNMVIMSVPLIFAYIIAFKAKHIIDAYGIRDEIIKQCFFVFLSLFVYFIAFLSLEIGKVSSHSNFIYNELDRLEWCSYMIVGQILICGLTMSSTYYPIYLFNYKTKHGISTTLFEPDTDNTMNRSYSVSSGTSTRYETSISSNTKPSFQTKPSLHIEYSSNGPPGRSKNGKNGKNGKKVQSGKKADKSFKSKYANCLQTVLRTNKGLSLFFQHLVNEFATENLLFMIELIHIKHAFVLKNYGVVKTIKPERLKAYVQSDKMVNQNRFVTLNNDIDQIPELNEISTSCNGPPFRLPVIHRATSNSHSEPPPPLSIDDVSANPSIHSLPSLQPSITPAHSASIASIKDGVGVTSSHLETMRESAELEMDPENDYQVIDFNDVGDGDKRESLYYKQTHTYLFSEHGIAARLELPSDVPLSSITTTHKDLYSQMKALYTKYIEPSSDHELNISHEARNFLHAALNGTQKHESFYFNVFDFCAVEVMRLLIRIFRRFRTTGLYSAYLDFVVLKEKEVQKDVEASKIGEVKITFEGEKKKKEEVENEEKDEAAEKDNKCKNCGDDEKEKSKRKTLVPKFYTGNKHQEILAKYIQSNDL